MIDKTGRLIKIRVTNVKKKPGPWYAIVISPLDPQDLEGGYKILLPNGTTMDLHYILPEDLVL